MAVRTHGPGAGQVVRGDADRRVANAAADCPQGRLVPFGALQGFLHPISVARQVMEQLPHVFLVGEGAARFAAEIGAEAGEKKSIAGEQARDNAYQSAKAALRGDKSAIAGYADASAAVSTDMKRLIKVDTLNEAGAVDMLLNTLMPTLGLNASIFGLDKEAGAARDFATGASRGMGATDIGEARAEAPYAEAALWTVRFPRVVLALLVGACLAVAGVLMQGIFGNPLAEPGVPEEAPGLAHRGELPRRPVARRHRAHPAARRPAPRALADAPRAARE